jgi:hypothetical protein
MILIRVLFLSAFSAASLAAQTLVEIGGKANGIVIELP